MSLPGFLFNTKEDWESIDHRVDGWLFMSSIWPVSVLIVLAFVVVLNGSMYMRTRKALDIGTIMAFFNIFMVIFNVYIACQLWIGGSRKQYSWICQANDSTATDIEEMRIVKAMHLWFICKLVEMFDSFFLIARKKPTGKLMLMLFHHVFMVYYSWTVVRWMPGGFGFAPGFINTSIHAVMNAYFFLVIFLPRALKPSIKKAFNFFMMIQHVGIIIYCLIIIWVDCPLKSMFAYPIVLLFLGMTIYHLKIYFFDYQRHGNEREGFVGFSIKRLFHHQDNLKPLNAKN